MQFFGFGRDDSGTASPVLRTGSAVVVPAWNKGRGDASGGPSWTIRKNGNGNIAPGDSGGGAYKVSFDVGGVEMAEGDPGGAGAHPTRGAVHSRIVDGAFSQVMLGGAEEI